MHYLITAAASYLFRCRHGRLSRPMTARQSQEIYLVCLVLQDEWASDLRIEQRVKRSASLRADPTGDRPRSWDFL